MNLLSSTLSLITVALLSAAGAEITSPSTQPDSGNLRTFFELIRKDVRSEKALILAQNIDFNQDEAISFWPLYSEYEVELSKWYDKRFTLLKNYLDHEGTMTDDEAQKLADNVFSLEKQRTDLKRKYYKKFAKIIGAKKSARFFQVENQLNAAIDVRIAAEVPLIK
jgi:hypothetical protein